MHCRLAVHLPPLSREPESFRERTHLPLRRPQQGEALSRVSQKPARSFCLRDSGAVAPSAVLDKSKTLSRAVSDPRFMAGGAIRVNLSQRWNSLCRAMFASAPTAQTAHKPPFCVEVQEIFRRFAPVSGDGHILAGLRVFPPKSPTLQGRSWGGEGWRLRYFDTRGSNRAIYPQTALLWTSPSPSPPSAGRGLCNLIH
jgi:hypothetical protein